MNDSHLSCMQITDGWTNALHLKSVYQSGAPLSPFSGGGASRIATQPGEMPSEMHFSLFNPHA